MPRSKILLIAPGLCALLLFTGCGAVLVNEGSKDEPLTDGLKNPEALQVRAKVTAAQEIISNFEDGTPRMDPRLYGARDGAWSASCWGGGKVDDPFVVAGGAAGTNRAVHIFGTLTNKGDNSYPSFTLAGKFKASGFYDASPFQGIRFYYKCPSDDQATGRRFTLPIGPTLPTSAGGTCTDGCYNHFGYDLSRTNGWVLITLPFGDLKRQPGWGSSVTPPDFTDHLKEIADIEWAHGAGNTAGTYNIDYWVDEVEFF